MPEEEKRSRWPCLREKHPLNFVCLLFGVVFLLVGGGLWGSGQDAGNRPKEVAGIVLGLTAVVLLAFYIAGYVARKIRERMARKRLKPQWHAKDVYDDDDDDDVWSPSPKEDRADGKDAAAPGTGAEEAEVEDERL